MKTSQLIILLGITIGFSSCNNDPKVITTPVSSSSSEKQTTGILSDETTLTSASTAAVTNDMHTVKVLEVLPTSKYVYLNVDEKGKKFWIATSKKDVKVGETYFYKKGILKTNFESKEHNRIFKKVYLVANIVRSNDVADQGADMVQRAEVMESDSPKNIEIEGSMKISELIKNKKKYNGKEIQISGTCTKLNPNILGRNWIHLKDGSMDEYDLVVTSETAVPAGQVVTMKGIVILDKDFGAGYLYDFIIENGQIVTSK
ncbi:MAG: hypothetical protein ACJATI_004293 [Halioglobus sp.]|jgi:hypothetical protein